MVAQEVERDILGGLTAEQRAPGRALANTSNSSEYAPTVFDDHPVEKTATRASNVNGADGLSEKGVHEDEDPAAVRAREEAEAGILTGAKLYLVFISLMLSVFVSPTPLPNLHDVEYITDTLDVCAGPIDRCDSHPGHCFRFSVIHPSRLDVSIFHSWPCITSRADLSSITAYFCMLRSTLSFTFISPSSPVASLIRAVHTRALDIQAADSSFPSCHSFVTALLPYCLP